MTTRWTYYLYVGVLAIVLIFWAIITFSKDDDG